jgi:tetratricopeptide (TPR) repeat protein
MNNTSRDLELEKQIDAYIKGKLSEGEALKLWEQLLRRPDYIELLEIELGVKSIMENRSSSDNNIDDSTSAEQNGIIYSLQRSQKWLAAAAAVALLVIAINILQVDTNQNIDNLTLNEINIVENLSSAPILRSQKSELTPADSLLNRGFEEAISGNMSRALQLYNEIIENHGDKSAAIQAYLNKGIIQYNAGHFTESITSFNAVLDNVADDKPVITEKAYWYLGNAYINVEKLNEARDAIHQVFSMDGIYRKSAFRLLRKLDYELDNIDYDDFEQQREGG